MKEQLIRQPSYFLVAVSNRLNLDLCMRYALAGFSNSSTGVWAYLDIQEGDYISFLYAARAFNLYQVVKKQAILDFKDAPPWPPVTFRESGKTYYYPFRLFLKPERKLNEPIVRNEFAYVAENLLLRAGYRKTQFQSDQTTLQLVSQMGNMWSDNIDTLEVSSNSTFTPLFTRRKAHRVTPEVFPFNELILQSAIRQKLAQGNYLTMLLDLLSHNSLLPGSLEILSEKAVAEGHVDILIKDAVPIGMARKIIIEVKLDKAKTDDLLQLKGYLDEFGLECIGGVLIAENFSKDIIAQSSQFGIHLIRYELDGIWDRPQSFAEISSALKLIAM